MALDQRDLRPQNRRARGGHQSSSTGADHHQVVAARRFGIGPVRRMSIFNQLFVEFVGGLHLNLRWSHCRLPPQLEPAPAVQPKQWLSVAIRLFANSEKLSISQMFVPPGVSRSSIWLKSQS